MAYLNNTFFGQSPLMSKLGQALTKFRQRRARAESIRVTMRELSALSDRELDDLGVHRGAISEVARRVASEI